MGVSQGRNLRPVAICRERLSIDNVWPYYPQMQSDIDPPQSPTRVLIGELERSVALNALVQEAWEAHDFNDAAREQVPVGLCAMTLDHGWALRSLLLEVPPSAIALLRLQYESLVRATWARYAAPDRELALLLAPLAPESEQAAKKLPGLQDMLAAIEKEGPPGAGELLARARTRLWAALNSFVHGGIHPFQRGRNGYPVTMLRDVLKNTNAMSMVTLVLLAEITQDTDTIEMTRELHREFEDLLPALEPIAQ